MLDSACRWLRTRVFTRRSCLLPFPDRFRVSPGGLCQTDTSTPPLILPLRGGAPRYGTESESHIATLLFLIKTSHFVCVVSIFLIDGCCLCFRLTVTHKKLELIEIRSENNIDLTSFREVTSREFRTHVPASNVLSQNET